MLNRFEAPAFQRIEEISLPAAEQTTFANGNRLLLVNAGQQDAVKLDFIFTCGRRVEQKKGVAHFIVKLFLSGTQQYTAADVADLFGRLGAFTEVSQTSERFTFSVYCIAEHAAKCIELVHMILSEATYPEDELSISKAIALQQWYINQEKTAFIAGNAFREALFGGEHPLGASDTPEAMEAINRTDLLEFYTTYLLQKPYLAVLSGRFSEDQLIAAKRLIENYQTTLLPAVPALMAQVQPAQQLLIEKEDSLQSSIRIGRLTFPRTHSDYLPYTVMNAILGGYFGSRLMKNIREDKGYTYGISSSQICLQHLGYWAIATDVKKEFTQQTLDEIWKEIRILQDELVEETELEIVKNYIAGQLAASVTTPFDVAEKYKTCLFEQLPTDYYQTLIIRLREVTAEQIRDMARRYLQPELVSEIVVGGK